MSWSIHASIECDHLIHHTGNNVDDVVIENQHKRDHDHNQEEDCDEPPDVVERQGMNNVNNKDDNVQM